MVSASTPLSSSCTWLWFVAFTVASRLAPACILGGDESNKQLMERDMLARVAVDVLRRLAAPADAAALDRRGAFCCCCLLPELVLDLALVLWLALLLLAWVCPIETVASFSNSRSTATRERES